MKFLIVFSAFFISLCACTLMEEDERAALIDPSLDEHWSEFKNKYDKSYHHRHHEIFRRKIWEQNSKKIKKHNAEYEQGLHMFRVKMNNYGDLSHDEFVRKMNGFQPELLEETEDDERRERRATFSTTNTSTTPGSIDWRQFGYVTGVRSQGSCGSCWAFAAVASLEGQFRKKTGVLMTLSEQNLIDCTKNGKYVDYYGKVEPKVSGVVKVFQYSADGCNGGSYDAGFQYSKYNRVTTSSNYPFTGIQGTCTGGQYYDYLTSGTEAGYTHVIPKGNEMALVNAIASVGPIAVAIDASDIAFQFYSEGIYSSSDCSNPDHAVTVVGYGSDGFGKDYYIVKNSWSKYWGEQGYFKLARNQNNMCGIANYASYPLV